MEHQNEYALRTFFCNARDKGIISALKKDALQTEGGEIHKLVDDMSQPIVLVLAAPFLVYGVYCLARDSVHSAFEDITKKVPLQGCITLREVLADEGSLDLLSEQSGTPSRLQPPENLCNKVSE